MLLELDRRSIDLGTAAHEMIHQLASDSGLVPRHDAFPDLAARRVGRAVRGDPRRPMGGHQPCARFEAPGLAADRKARSVWSAWSATPALAAAIIATCTPRPGPWSIIFAPSVPASSSPLSTCCAVRALGREPAPSTAGRPRFRRLSAGLRHRHGPPGAAIGGTFMKTVQTPLEQTCAEPETRLEIRAAHQVEARVDGIDRTRQIAKIDRSSMHSRGVAQPG